MLDMLGHTKGLGFRRFFGSVGLVRLVDLLRLFGWLVVFEL